MANIDFKKPILFLFIVSVPFLFLIFSKVNSEQKTTKVCYQSHCFEAELAKTKAEKRKGLKERKNLDKDKAMLFSYPQERKLSFWMKDVLIPLDIIWLSKNKEVIKIKHKAQPCKSEPCPAFKPKAKSQYVLEIKGGRAKEIGLKKGKELNFNEKSSSK